MAISVNYGPTASLGGMMYGAGQNLENNERMKQLMQWLMAIRGQNLDRLGEQERQGLQREMFDKGQSVDRERMGMQEEQFKKELAQREKDRMDRVYEHLNQITMQRDMANRNRGDWRDGFGGSFMNYGRPRTFLGREW